MRQELDTSHYDLPIGALIDTAAFEGTPESRSRVKADLRIRLEKNRVTQKEWSRGFDHLYEDARRDEWSAPLLIEWAAALLEKQRTALERFHPMLTILQRYAEEFAAQDDPEVLVLCQATIDWVLGWMEPYQSLCTKMIALASERLSASGTVLYARPIEGEVDHEALSREFMARFPKIRAALAK